MALARCVEVLGSPQHPEHLSARAQLEAWEAEQPQQLCVGLARMVCSQGPEAARQLAAVVLKNAIRRVCLESGALEELREAALTALADRSSLVRSGGASVVDVLARDAWPSLVARLQALLVSADENAVDGALRAVEAVAASYDAWPALDEAGSAMAEAVARHITHASAAIRLRSLRCARLVGWVQNAALSDTIALLSIVALDADSGVRAEVLASLRALLPRLVADAGALASIAEHALASLSDDEAVAVAAAEWWRACARSRAFDRGVLPRLVPRLLLAMRYTMDEVTGFESENMSVSVPDRPEDVEPTQWYEDDDDDEGDDDIEWDDEDFAWEDEDEEDGWSPQDAWSTRKCAASALEALGRADANAMVSVALPQIAAAVGGDAWAREAAMLALGAVSVGCAATLRAHVPSVAPFLLRVLVDEPVPQLREMAAWVLGRGAVYWFFSFSRAGPLDANHEAQSGLLLKACIESLCATLKREDHKRVLESAASSTRRIVLVAGQAVAPHASSVASAAGTVILRSQARARACAYALTAALASKVELDDESRLALLGPLETRWSEDLDDMYALLGCVKAVARAHRSRRRVEAKTARYYVRMATRCLVLVDRASSATDSEDDARAAAGLGAYALDVLSQLFVPLGSSLVAAAARSPPGWEPIDRALAGALAGVDGAKGSSEKLALASAAAALLPTLGAFGSGTCLVSLSDQARAGLLACIEAPLSIDAHRSAANMASQNAAFVVGDLAPRCNDQRLALFFTVAGVKLAKIVEDVRADSSTAAAAALALSKCVVNEAVAPSFVTVLGPWLSVVARSFRGTDPRESQCKHHIDARYRRSRARFPSHLRCR